MPTRDGNKIIYMGDPGMDNAEEGDSPKMGFMGGLGGPGVRENKQVGASSEIVIPVKQSFIIAFGTAGMLFAVYIVLKAFVYTRADWSLLIGIMTIVVVPILIVATDRFLKAQVPNFYADVIRSFNASVYSENRAKFIVTLLIVVLVIYAIVDFYVSVIVPQATMTLNDEAQLVALICAVIGWIVAYKPFKKFFVTQLTNSLRDSDSKYAISSLMVEDYWRRRKAGIIEGEFTVEDDVPQQNAPLLGHHMIVNPAAGRTIKPGTEDLYFNMMVSEFLDGIESKAWTTSERSWKDKRLVRSGVNLTAVGDEIRDTLIASKYAEWLHPSQPNQGWRLTADISQIKGHAFAKSRVPKKQIAPPSVIGTETVEEDDDGTDTETTGQDSTTPDETTTWSPENWK